jgi:hypothetical protein
LRRGSGLCTNLEDQQSTVEFGRRHRSFVSKIFVSNIVVSKIKRPGIGRYSVIPTEAKRSERSGGTLCLAQASEISDLEACGKQLRRPISAQRPQTLHSQRRAVMGSTANARSAGTRQAIAATAITSSETPNTVSGS